MGAWGIGLTRAARVLAVLAALLGLAPAPAGAEVRLEVVETDPGSPATLGHWHRFNVRIRYESDQPIRVHGQAYHQGKQVTWATSGSAVHPPGVGEAMFWFAFTTPAQVDRLVLRAYPARGATPLTEAAIDVELLWTGEQMPAPVPAPWVQQMDAEEARRQKEAYQAYMSQPTPPWQVALFFALAWSPVAYLVVQIVALRRFRGGWRAAAAAPVLPMSGVLAYTVLAFQAGSNLFPLVLIFTSPVALLYLLAVAGLRRSRRRSAT
jgi:hypothetical protein